jgi:hypothetical protein
MGAGKAHKDTGMRESVTKNRQKSHEKRPRDQSGLQKRGFAAGLLALV